MVVECLLTLNEAVMLRKRQCLFSSPLHGLVARGALQCQPTNQAPWNQYEFFLLGLLEESHYIWYFPGPKWIDWCCCCCLFVWKKNGQRILEIRPWRDTERPCFMDEASGVFFMVSLENVLGELWGRGFKLRTEGESSSSHLPSPSLFWCVKPVSCVWE